MPFCSKCKSLMLPKDGKFVCSKCGTMKAQKGKSIVVEKQTEKETIVLDKEKNLLPKTRVGCPKCGHNEAYWILRQTRASDEPETRIFTCTKCEHRWRAY